MTLNPTKRAFKLDFKNTVPVFFDKCNKCLRLSLSSGRKPAKSPENPQHSVKIYVSPCFSVCEWRAGRQGGREGGRALVRRSCSCVNHVGPYASFLRRAHASEIDRQPSLARSGVGRGRARSQPRTCHNQRRAASGGEGVEGWGGAYVSRHSCSAAFSESQARPRGCKTSP